MVACSIGRQVLCGRSRPAASPGKPSCGGAPKPTRRNRSHIASRGSASASFAAPTLEDFCDHLRHAQRRRGMHVVDGVVARCVRRPGAVLHDRGRGVTLPVSSASATVKGFSVEPGSNRSVMTRLRSCAPGEPRAVVRVEGRAVGQREDLAGAHVERDERARLRAVLLDRALERAVGEALDLAVDRRAPGRAPSCAGADRLDVLDDAAQAVLDHAPAAGLAAERRLVRELDALLPGVVDAGEADHVRGHFAAGVVAPVFALLVDALEAERRDARPRFRATTWRLRYTKSRERSASLLSSSRGSRPSSAASFLSLRRPTARRRPGAPRSTSPASRPRAPRRCGRGCGRASPAPRARASSARRPSPAGSRSASPAGRARAPASTAKAAEQRRQHEAGAPYRQAHQARVDRLAASPRGLRPHDAHAARIGRAQAERARGDALDARVQRPGARLELQLAVLDVERARAILLALELGEQLSRAGAGR